MIITTSSLFYPFRRKSVTNNGTKSSRESSAQKAFAQKAPLRRSQERQNFQGLGLGVFGTENAAEENTALFFYNAG